MKRDSDLIRTLLLKYEAAEEWLIPHIITLDASYEHSREYYHLNLMIDDGLLVKISDDCCRMTSAGHDFTDAIRDEGLWNETKKVVAETGGNAAISVLKAIAIGFLKKKIKDHTEIEI